MKKLIKNDNRVLVQDEKTPWDKKPVMCTCPNCGAEIPYRVFSRQVQASAHVLYDRQVIVAVLKELGRTTTGEFTEKYRETSRSKMTDRRLNSLLHELESMGVIRLCVRSLGRHGRTTDIKFIKDVPKNMEKAFFLDGRSLRWQTNGSSNPVSV